MRVCSICGAKWRGDPEVCPLDGGALEELPDEVVGRTIADRYTVLERVGAGGMGTVYRARQELVGRDVALKFLSPELALEPTHRRRFLREAKAANRIDHPNIIDISDYGETDDGLVYLVMEFLVGEPLSDTVDRGGLGVRRAVSIAMQMASALARAHELDVIHRDIKPENVYLLPGAAGDDFVKLLDFGLAAMKGELRLTATGLVFGTPEYMAPEQARGAPVTGKADLYALGCVLYEMIAGEPPFSGSAPDLILKHIREPAPRLSERAPHVSAELEAVVMQLLEKDPARRHEDAHRVVDALRPFVGGRPDATIQQAEFASVIARERALLKTAPRESGESMDRVEVLRALSARAHPRALPTWLSDALVELEALASLVAAQSAELALVRRMVSDREGRAADGRLSLDRAIDALGRDEARVTAYLDERRPRLAALRERLAAVEEPLLAAWAGLAPPASELTRASVQPLSSAGRLASEWLEHQRDVEELDRELAAHEREQEDLRFQRSQLRGRLGTLGAEATYELNELESRAQSIEAELGPAALRLDSLSKMIEDHLRELPDMADALNALRR